LPLLIACGGSSGGSSRLRATETAQAQLIVDATQTAISVTPTPAPPIQVGAIVWATKVDPITGEPTTTVESFRSTARTIYAVVPVKNVEAGMVFTASWTYNDVALDRLSTVMTVESDVNAEWVEFHLTRSDDPWPDGQYAVAIQVDGEIVRQSSVAVENR